MKRSNIPALVGAIGAALTTGGPTYAFGLYGAALKRNLGLSQGDLDTISTAFFVAGLLSWAPGLFADRYGARLAICIGGLTGCTSLLLYWMIAKQYIVISSHFVLVTLLSLLGVCTFESSAMVTGSVFKVLTVTAGPTKGAAVGVAKGLVGLGSGVYTCIFESIKTSHESDLDFLPLAAILFVSCATLPALFLIPSRKALQSSENFIMEARPWHFRLLYCGLLGMGCLIVWNSLTELFHSEENARDEEAFALLALNQGKDDGAGDNDDSDNNHQHDDTSPIRQSGKSSWIAAILLLLWWGPLVFIYWSPRTSDNGGNISSTGSETMNNHSEDAAYQTVQSQDDDEDQAASVASSDNESTPPDEPVFAQERQRQDTHHLLTTDHTDMDPENRIHHHPPVMAHATPVHPDRNLLQMLATPEAYCLIWSSTIMVGSGTVETNNMGQMVEALGLSAAVTPASMALFSVAQAAARVVTGAASEYTLQTYAWPRPVYLVVAACVGVGAHLLLGWATSEFTFVLGAALSGVNFGMVWPLLVLCVGEIFGASHVGANYMFYDGFASAAGTFFLSKMIAQDVYEHHIDTHTAPDAYTCIGTDCFRVTHYVIALLCLTCVASGAAFVMLTKDVYKPIQPIDRALTDDEMDDDDDDIDEDEEEEEEEEEEEAVARSGVEEDGQINLLR